MYNSKKILLVEDTPEDAELTLLAFKRKKIPIKIDIVKDGVEALDYLFNNDNKKLIMPDIVLMDLKLPKVDGIEVLKKIRENKTTKLLPVVILTSSKEEKDIFNCYKHGANSYICKSIDFDKFSNIIEVFGEYWFKINELPPNENLS